MLHMKPRALTAAAKEWAGLAALLLVLLTVSAEASGVFVKLGGSNAAARPTGFENTGPGPAIRLRTQPAEPPFSVNSSKLVKGFNAELLRGRPSGAYAPAAGSLEYASSKDARLLAASHVSGLPGQLLKRTVRAPATGTIFVTVVGECLADDGHRLSLALKAGANSTVVRYGQGLSGGNLARIGCPATVPTDVAQGEEVPVTLSWTSTGGQLSAAMVLVTFDPTPVPRGAAR